MGDPVTQGCLARILFPWWLGGCRPLPFDKDTELQELAGLTQVRWYRKRDNIKSRLKTLVEQLSKKYEKLVIANEKLAIRNQIGSEALKAYRDKQFLQKKAIKNLSQGISTAINNQMVNNVSILDDGLTDNPKLIDCDNRVDIVLPHMLSGHGQHTPNSFKHKPPKPKGTLRDK